ADADGSHEDRLLASDPSRSLDGAGGIPRRRCDARFNLIEASLTSGTEANAAAPPASHEAGPIFFGLRSSSSSGFGGLSCLCVILHSTEVDELARLVADDPRVVPGRDRYQIARAELDLRPVRHRDDHATRGDVAEVRRLAALGPRGRRKVRRPS